MVPVVYRCKHCGKVLYVFSRVGQDFYGIPTPSEVAAWFNGFCPYCGAKLAAKPPSPSDVRIRPFYDKLKVPVKAKPHEMLSPLPHSLVVGGEAKEAVAFSE